MTKRSPNCWDRGPRARRECPIKSALFRKSRHRNRLNVRLVAPRQTLIFRRPQTGELRSTKSRRPATHTLKWDRV